jgi:hypothetical protein
MHWDCLVADCGRSFFAFRLEWKVGSPLPNSFSISDQFFLTLASDLTLAPDACCSSSLRALSSLLLVMLSRTGGFALLFSSESRNFRRLCSVRTDAGVFLALLLPCGAFAGSSTLGVGVHSMLSVFSMVFAVPDLSEENELRTGGDGVLNFRELKYSSLLMTGDLSSSSRTDSGERNLLCFPDDELLICRMEQVVYLGSFRKKPMMRL